MPTSKPGTSPTETSDYPALEAQQGVQLTRQRGVGAVEVAAAILEVMLAARNPLTLTEISNRCGYSSAQVHHYLVSLVRTGFARREQRPVRYSLGSFCLRLGLGVVDRVELQHISAKYLHDISSATQEASFFSIWAPTGAVVVRWEQGQRPLTVVARLGTVMPLITSATGIAFCSWYKNENIAQAIEKSLRQEPPAERALKSEILCAAIKTSRANRCSVAEGSMLPYVNAICVPVFDGGGAMAGALTVLGLSRSMQADVSGKVATALRQVASAMAHKLGYEGEFYDV